MTSQRGTHSRSVCAALSAQSSRHNPLQKKVTYMNEKKMGLGPKIGIGCAGIFVLFLLMAGCGAVIAGGGDDGDQDTAPVEDETTEPVEPPPGEEEPQPDEGNVASEEDDSLSDGIHQVGEDIEPGTYTTDGPDENDIMPNCYYARLSGLSGELDDVISNNNSEGPATVEVADSDAALELSGGCEWELMD